MTLSSIDLDARLVRAMAGMGMEPKTAASTVDDENEEDDGDDELTSRDEEGVTTTPVEDTVVAQDSDVEESKSPVTGKNLFQHPEAHPLLLDLVLLQKYGPEWMTWEVETLRLRVGHDFRQDIGDLNMHKIQAAKTLHFVDTYWEEWEVFCWVTMALNGVPPDFVVMQVPTVAQCMVSVDIANRIRSDVPFNLELNDYLEQVHIHDGILVPIEPLKFVTMDDLEDYPIEEEDVKALWPAVRVSGVPPKADTVTAEQLRRMLLVHEHLEESREQLREQLPLVGHV